MIDLLKAYHLHLYNLLERMPNVCLAFSTYAQRMSNVCLACSAFFRRSRDVHRFEYKYGANLDVSSFAISSSSRHHATEEGQEGCTQDIPG